MSIAIIDYGMGNVSSVANMLRKLGVEPELVSDAAGVRQAGKIILPGVGAFDNAMLRLREIGLVEPLLDHVEVSGRPLLGICLGMQLLGKGSQEGVEAGLGLLDFSAVHFSNLDGWTNRHIPNLGWNQVDVVKPDPLLAGLEAGARFYFAHSYAVPADQSAHVAATVTYGTLYAACIRRGSVFGAQFHPEKSHRFGLKLFANFIGNQSAERG